jgi:hypothetical protein
MPLWLPCCSSRLSLALAAASHDNIGTKELGPADIIGDASSIEGRRLGIKNFKGKKRKGWRIMQYNAFPSTSSCITSGHSTFCNKRKSPGMNCCGTCTPSAQIELDVRPYLRLNMQGPLASRYRTRLTALIPMRTAIYILHILASGTKLAPLFGLQQRRTGRLSLFLYDAAAAWERSACRMS